MTPRIGIIGLDEAGTQAAHRLLAARPGVALTVYDSRGARCEPFRGKATLADTADEVLRESDVVVLALPDGHEVDRTLRRYSDGRVTAVVADKLIVDLTPLARAEADMLASALQAAGAGYTRAEPTMAHAAQALGDGLLEILRT